MNRFRQTLGQSCRASLSAEQRLAEWPTETVPEILTLLWTAYDRLVARKLSRINLETATLQLERSVCEHLADEIQTLLRERGGFATFNVSQERFEYETLDPQASTRPPQYDIAFIWNEDSTLLWPCEAKVLKRDGDVAAYLADVHGAFLTCMYAPFSCSGAMLGFLVSGQPDHALANIESRLDACFVTVTEHTLRPHRASRHRRSVPSGKPYPEDFLLHHLIMALSPG